MAYFPKNSNLCPPHSRLVTCSGRMWEGPKAIPVCAVEYMARHANRSLRTAPEHPHARIDSFRRFGLAIQLGLHLDRQCRLIGHHHLFPCHFISHSSAAFRPIHPTGSLSWKSSPRWVL